MSSLYKSGFVNFNPAGMTPYIVDANTRVITPISERKIEPAVLEEELDEDEIAANQALLDDAMDKAKELRDDARDKANKIVDDAKEEADSIRENAYNEGYEEGLVAGREEAKRQNTEYLSKLKQEQQEMRKKIDEDNEEYINDTEEKLIGFACEIIKKISGIIVDDYKPVMMNMINNALNDAEASKKYTIKIAEENYAYVFDNSDRIAGATNPNITIDIVADPKLSKGQCMIETDNGIIDLSMDVQVKNLITAIKLLS